MQWFVVLRHLFLFLLNKWTQMALFRVDLVTRSPFSSFWKNGTVYLVWLLLSEWALRCVLYKCSICFSSLDIGGLPRRRLVVMPLIDNVMLRTGRPLGRGVERQFSGASASCSNPLAEEETFCLRQLALVLLAILKALPRLGLGLVSSLLCRSGYQGSLKGHYDHSLLLSTCAW